MVDCWPLTVLPLRHISMRHPWWRPFGVRTKGQPSAGQAVRIMKILVALAAAAAAAVSQSCYRRKVLRRPGLGSGVEQTRCQTNRRQRVAGPGRWRCLFHRRALRIAEAGPCCCSHPRIDHHHLFAALAAAGRSLPLQTDRRLFAAPVAVGYCLRRQTSRRRRPLAVACLCFRKDHLPSAEAGMAPQLLTQTDPPSWA